MSADPRLDARNANAPTIPFGELLAKTPAAKRAEIMSMSPTSRVRVFLNWMEKADEEAQVASKLLELHKGDARAAEVDAWAMFDIMAEGTVGDRRNKDGGMFAREVVNHILQGTEDPPVARTVPERVRFA